MNIERVFKEKANTTIQEVIKSLIDEKIDSLIKEYYYQAKVNTATSHEEGKRLT